MTETLGLPEGVDPRDLARHRKLVSDLLASSRAPLIESADRRVNSALRRVTGRHDLWVTMSLAVGYASSHTASVADAIDALAAAGAPRTPEEEDAVHYAEAYQWLGEPEPRVVVEGAITLSREYTADVLVAAANGIGLIQRCTADHEPDQEAILQCIRDGSR